MKLLRLYFKFIRWCFSCGVVLWFVATLLLPLYGWLSPWQSASDRLKEEGFIGLPLMIGISSSSEHVGDRWKEERQRAYVILPDSFRHMEIVVYQKSSGSETAGVKKEIIWRHWLIPFFALWILAGVFSVKITLPWRRKVEASQAPPTTAMTQTPSTTPPAPLSDS